VYVFRRTLYIAALAMTSLWKSVGKILSEELRNSYSTKHHVQRYEKSCTISVITGRLRIPLLNLYATVPVMPTGWPLTYMQLLACFFLWLSYWQKTFTAIQLYFVWEHVLHSATRPASGAYTFQPDIVTLQLPGRVLRFLLGLFTQAHIHLLYRNITNIYIQFL